MHACLVTELCTTLFNPWTYQAPLSMGFSSQEYWSELPYPSPGEDLKLYTHAFHLHEWNIPKHKCKVKSRKKIKHNFNLTSLIDFKIQKLL